VSFTVTASSGTPNGQVTISDQNGGGCTGNAPSGSCSYTPNGTGARTIMAGYSGNSSFNGSTDTETHTVNEPPPPPNGAPTAVIGSISCSGMSCTFTDASTDPNGSETIEQWNWLFGDGDNSSEQNPSHDYAVAGDYTVTLTGTGALIAKARQS